MKLADLHTRSQDRSLIRGGLEMFPIGPVRGLLFVGARALGTPEGQACVQAPQMLLLEEDILHQDRVTHPPGK